VAPIEEKGFFCKGAGQKKFCLKEHTQKQKPSMKSKLIQQKQQIQLSQFKRDDVTVCLF